MTCDEADNLIHPLIDGELDAAHARDVEAHVAGCARCAASLADYRAMRRHLAAADLAYAAPEHLRRRIVARLPAPQAERSRRALLKGFAFGAAASAAAASGVVFMVLRSQKDDRLFGEVVSAHLRSLQGERLIEVASTDRHTVKPWFNGRLDLAPPVVDLTAQGFTLLGGRLDYLDGQAVAAIVYRRRIHVINLFVARAEGALARNATTETLHGFHIRRWSEQGFNLWAASDINSDELQEFEQRFKDALRTSG
jgi:anti-sigma factor RsiW